MLTPLSKIVGRWSPQRTRTSGAGEPRGLRNAVGDVLAVWEQIVGDEVARHAVPLERGGDMLLVLTTSSAWSNQLSLLSGHIVCALNEAGIEGIERLRFRVGRMRRASSPRSAESTNGRHPRSVASLPTDDAVPAATLDDSVLRLRERLVRTRDAKRADGWNACRECGAMLPEGDHCAPCATAELTERSARVQRLMFDVPWLGYDGIAEVVEDLSRDEYEANRTALLARWWEALERVRRTGKLSRDGRERQIASSYLLLRTGWEPERITPVIARSQLGDELYDLIYEAHHNQQTVNAKLPKAR